MTHEWGVDEGGFRLCINCGMTKHDRAFYGYTYWLNGTGNESAAPCKVVTMRAIAALKASK